MYKTMYSIGGILSVLEYANLMDEITKEVRKNPKCNINIGNETTPGCFLWMDDVVLMHTDPRMIQNMLDTMYRIAQRYRIKFGTEKSKVLHIGPLPLCETNSPWASKRWKQLTHTNT